MRALVTGSAGFLGRHFVERLEGDGWEVCGLDVRPGQGTALAPAGVELDCRDYFRHDRTTWDLAIHCAAVVEGRETIERRPARQIVDLSLDAECFAWALRANVRRLVYISSSAVYPVALQCAGSKYRLREPDVILDHPQLPDALYGWTKLTGERLAQVARGEGLGVTVVRHFSGYGADQDVSYPFRAILERVRRREDPLEVWGSGGQVRDWIHVDDLVSATLAAAGQEVDGPLNLCTGVGTSISELAEMMARVAGYRPEIRRLGDRPAGVAHRVGHRGRMLTYYRPRVELRDAVIRALGRD